MTEQNVAAAAPAAVRDAAPGAAAAEEPLRREVRDRILVLTLNRPHAKNAVNLALATALAGALEEFDADPQLRVCVVRGAGGSFCAGMDLRAFAAGEVPIVPGRGFGGVAERTARKPVIAAVDGFALGGGFEIALACDLIVAGEDALFGLPEVTRGITANGGGLLRLRERIPYHVAMELVLTGRRISAAEAGALHLVNRVTAAGAALDGALALAAEIANNAPLAVQASKEVLLHAADWRLEERFERQRAVTSAIRGSRDAAEGARAFVEKRDPVWTGS
ncbi:crotonase/enoyl-CoA hydratase family protein [Microbacterium capsulatum]|uniref:Crotonase/enoyl-CoA hydratase family protein n=1 Tax=Microbacterium capsulatum TaxID=3041921 RepID=A0ABU0XIJ8_9MICO|nr:crotonase/enoyl-CoA hydratase family protein [Microbacterium sp. ASV81]MDQ4214489.1 crotonase/enoyl-CoA hydratase family protein [Microbacterium sp. ASV81]